MLHREKGRALYEINTRVWLGELSSRHSRQITLANVPPEEVERLADLGFDLVWLMGVWRVGEKSIEVARTHEGLQKEYRHVLPDYKGEDVIGSPYSVAEYDVAPFLGGMKGLVIFRNLLARKGVGLILDFVPNHTGVDHRWVTQRPEYYIQGDEGDLKREPGNYFKVKTAQGDKIIAHGRDPYFPGWTDTGQINVFHPGTRSGLQNVLTSMAGQCDGVRCDMAMLVLSDVFQRTWGERAVKGVEAPVKDEFWAKAIHAVREKHPRFLFIAEAYWGLEGKLQELGFDFTYDKTLYDRLRHGSASEIRAHLEAPRDHQCRNLRFLENHDEERAASAFSADRHRAAAVVAGTTPGLTLVHDGQLEGRKAKLPVQLRRRPNESVDAAIRDFYERLLHELKDPTYWRGKWQVLPVSAAWEGNPTWDNFIAYQWEAQGNGTRWVVVNFGPTQGQCYMKIDNRLLEGKKVELFDLLGSAQYLRDGSELLSKGLYLDMPSFGYHVFRVSVKG